VSVVRSGSRFPSLRARSSAGSPLWMTSLADMMTLLLCLFVFMFTFADMSAPKFDEFSGRMKDAFGAGTTTPNGSTGALDDLSFSPSPSTVWSEGDGRLATANSYDVARREFARLRAALAPELQAGGVSMLLSGGRIRVRFDVDESAPFATRMLAAQRTAAVLRKVSELQPALEVPVHIVGASEALLALAEAAAGSDVTTLDPDVVRARADGIAVLERAFAPEIARGLLVLHRSVDSLVVRLGEGGAFAPGEASLTPLAMNVIDKVGTLASLRGARIVIGGHTDDRPIRTPRYRDNWDLSAARAIAVVRELVARRGIDPRRIEAQGFADTRPVAPNDSDGNRALNRRIEIEVRWAEN
jgi:flagellar motor protein MotB